MEDEKDDLIEQANNVLRKSNERRRKAAKFMQNSDDMTNKFLGNTRKKPTLLVDGTDPIHEELENEEMEEEDDGGDFRSDQNFYDRWQRHKQSLI